MRRVSLFISEDLLAGLDVLRAEHGTPHAESIRRAIAAYLAEKGVRTKPSKPRARKQKRA
jgi:metal-responsive CopG/Arc/MetJ family transcriptional regulator